MIIPVELFLQHIKEQKIYYYSSLQLNTSLPHYFICVKLLADGRVLQVVCTSQEAKVIERIEKTGLPYNTLVWIKPTNENGLNKDTYINCNQIFTRSLNEFREMYNKHQISATGEISESDFEQIRLGILASPRIDELHKVLFR